MDFIAFSYQLLDRFARPQSKCQLQLIRASISDQAYYGGGLMTRQPRPPRATALLRLQPCWSVGMILLDPFVNCSIRKTEDPCGFRSLHTIVDNSANYSASKIFLHLRRKRTCIFIKQPMISIK